MRRRERKRRHIKDQWPGHQHRGHMKKSKHKLNYVPCKPPNLNVSANLRSTPYQLFELNGPDDEAPRPFGPDPTGWFHLPPIPVLPTVYQSCQWCYEKVSATLKTAVDVMFPNQYYKDKLESTQKRLQELEAELASLRAEKTKIEKGSNVAKYQIPISTQTDMTDHCSRTMPPQSVHAAPPPPPPPPPPVRVQKPVRIINRKKNIQASASKPMISLEDIKKVRLKKPENRSRSTCRSDCDIGVNNQSISCQTNQLLCPSRLTLKLMKHTSDDNHLNLSPVLTGIKRRFIKVSRGKENVFNCVISEVKDYKNKLRKVDIDRSPGGTPRPDKKKRLETGTGLTPMMARALKKKFLLARSPSP